jgi:hypothetical protein
MAFGQNAEMQFSSYCRKKILILRLRLKIGIKNFHKIAKGQISQKNHKSKVDLKKFICRRK